MSVSRKRHFNVLLSIAARRSTPAFESRDDLGPPVMEVCDPRSAIKEDNMDPSHNTGRYTRVEKSLCAN